MSMIYQFERSEIKQCQNCDFAFGGGNLKIHYRYCTRQDEILDGHKTPQENDCPLVAISKTETTSCEWCEDVTKQYFDVNWYKYEDNMLFGVEHETNYCPACGRKLKENEHDISV